MNQYRKQVLPHLSNSQFAYRAGVWTTDAILSTQLSTGLKCSMIEALKLLRVCSRTLAKLLILCSLKLLVEMSIKSDILNLFMDYMPKRQQRVRINDALTPYLPITVGVPQGTTLASPMFWLAITPQGQCNTMFAYDITCSIPVSGSIDGDTQPVVEWGINWSAEHKMTLNLDKTKAMLIKLKPNTTVPTLFPR